MYIFFRDKKHRRKKSSEKLEEKNIIIHIHI